MVGDTSLPRPVNSGLGGHDAGVSGSMTGSKRIAPVMKMGTGSGVGIGGFQGVYPV